MLGISKFDPKKRKENPWFQCDKKLTCVCLHCPQQNRILTNHAKNCKEKRHSSWHEQSLFFQDKFCGFSYQNNVRKYGKRLFFFSSINLTNFSLLFFWEKFSKFWIWQNWKMFLKTMSYNFKIGQFFFLLFFPIFLLLLLQSCQVPLWLINTKESK
jgi:hypothetical protein